MFSLAPRSLRNNAARGDDCSEICCPPPFLDAQLTCAWPPEDEDERPAPATTRSPVSAEAASGRASRFVNRQERTSLDVLTIRFESPVRRCATTLIREQVLSADLHDARPGDGARREYCGEVEIVRDEDEVVLVRPRQDLVVGRGRSTRWWTSGQPRTRDAPSGRPSLATGSCPREASRLAQRNFDFLRPPGGNRRLDRPWTRCDRSVARRCRARRTRGLPRPACGP